MIDLKKAIKERFYLLIGLGVVGTIGVVSMTIASQEKEPAEHVTIAILAKDKAHTLPLYLDCIEKQTWPKEKTLLYIRTNNNNDKTADLLENWVKRVGHSYAKVYFDRSDLEVPVQNYGQHEWNAERFKVLGKIRQDSLDWAKKNDSHYFVVDCDNFIQPHTLQKLLSTNLPIVAPFLKVAEPMVYANYHANTDEAGYYADSPYYLPILSREVRGLVEVPVVHCAYLIRNEEIDKLTYDDDSYRYEYVIFSDSARKNQVPQYLDNRELYGRITFSEDAKTFRDEPWINEFTSK